MSNNVQVFTNSLFGNVRAFNIDDKVWFFAKDVVTDLGYNLEANSYTKYIKRFVKDKYAMKVNSKTQVQNGLEFDYKELGQRGGYLINQYGVIQLVMNSPMDEAEQFQDWILEEVVPSVLTTGSYSMEQKTQPQPPTLTPIQQYAITILDKNIDDATRVEALMGLRDCANEEGKAMLCDNNTITIPQIKDIVMKLYGKELDEGQVPPLSPTFIEWTRFLRSIGYVTYKKFPQKDNLNRLEYKPTAQPTELFRDVFVKQGMAMIRNTNDGRDKYIITYTKDIEKFILSDFFKENFLKYLGIK